MEAKVGGISGGKIFEVFEGNVAVKSRALAHVLKVGEFMGWVVDHVSMPFFSFILFHHIKVSEPWDLHFSLALASTFSC